MAELPNPEVVEDELGAPPQKPKGRSPLALILLTALLVGPGGIGGYTLYNRQRQVRAQKLAEYEAQAPRIEVTFPLETLTVNLADGDRYARLTAVLTFTLDPVDAAYYRTAIATVTGTEPPEIESPEEPAKSPKKQPGPEVKQLVWLLATRQPRLNDLLLSELGRYKYAQLLRPDARETVKQALVKRFDEVLTEAGIPVHDILLSDFVMQ